MPKTRSRRLERLARDQLVVRGLLSGDELNRADLLDAAVMNFELYGFSGISVWAVSPGQTAGELERTKLVKFERYAEFTVADVLDLGLELWATGQAPHYDVVGGEDPEDLVDRFSRAGHRIRVNPHVDREEH